ncbi:MAG: MgtC/SapB family protein [SAR324 cluster bacterium]
MNTQWLSWMPPEGTKLLLVLFLSFLIGLEREEHKGSAAQFAFGGVRTFPLIGLIGYAMALLSKDGAVPVALGFLVVGAFLLMSYWHKVASGGLAGVTTEMSGLAVYLVGALVYYEHYWAATSLCVAGVFLLQLKAGLESLTQRIAPDDILTFTKFLLLTAVILPIGPNQGFTEFDLNPYKTWLVVVAVSGISYGSYVLQRATKGQGGLMLSALLGGAYSSTVTTVMLARRSQAAGHAYLFTGGIVVASGMMYLRLAILVSLFNRQLMMLLGVPFLVLAASAALAGWLWSRRKGERATDLQRQKDPRNPLELRAALLFAVFFLAILVIARLAVTHFGTTGVYLLAGIMGVTDVDPFIIGMTQAAGGITAVQVAAAAITIAAASNNVAKGIYAYALSSKDSRTASLAALLGLALLGLLPLLVV